jgi:polysaccharide biosynthesis transport protein
MAGKRTLEYEDAAAEPRSLDLRDYWLIIRRRWKLVAAVAVIGAIAGAGYAVDKGPSYSATAQVEVAPVSQGPLSQSGQATAPVDMSTEQVIAQSAPVIQQAAAILGVPSATLDTESAKRLSVTVPASTLTTSNVLQISWVASSPATAQRGADAFASAYLSYRHQQLAGQIAALRTTLQQQVSSLRKQIATLSAQLSNTSGGSARQALTVQLNEISNQASVAEADLAALPTYNDSGGSIMAAARPNTPSGLSHSVVVALGLLLGLLLGLALAFVRDVFDDRLRSAAQLEQKLGAETLAMLPSGQTAADFDRGQGRGHIQPPPVINVAAAPDGQAADAARALRASVAAVAGRGDLRVLLLIAADPSVSCGQVVAELGVALAESGRRVLLLASDLRGSVLPQVFDISDSVGLSELLIKGGDAGLLARRPLRAAGAVLPARVGERLAVLPRGRRAMDALPGLDSPAMLDLLRLQRDAYDFVLLDAPPATATDVLSLAPHADGVIVLAREAHTKGKAVEALRNRLDLLGARVIGGVLIGKGILGRRRQSAGPATDGTQPARTSGPSLAREQGAAGTPVTRPLPAVPAGSIVKPVESGGTIKRLP